MGRRGGRSAAAVTAAQAPSAPAPPFELGTEMSRAVPGQTETKHEAPRGPGPPPPPRARTHTHRRRTAGPARLPRAGASRRLAGAAPKGPEHSGLGGEACATARAGREGGSAATGAPPTRRCEDYKSRHAPRAPTRQSAAGGGGASPLTALPGPALGPGSRSRTSGGRVWGCAGGSGSGSPGLVFRRWP